MSCRYHHIVIVIVIFIIIFIQISVRMMMMIIVLRGSSWQIPSVSCLFDSRLVSIEWDLWILIKASVNVDLTMTTSARSKRAASKSLSSTSAASKIAMTLRRIREGVKTVCLISNRTHWSIQLLTPEWIEYSVSMNGEMSIKGSRSDSCDSTSVGSTGLQLVLQPLQRCQHHELWKGEGASGGVWRQGKTEGDVILCKKIKNQVHDNTDEVNGQDRVIWCSTGRWSRTDCENVETSEDNW